mmetsp:Transcript_33863/g.56577  ORF Transcript_33863/g.56577 Transcript_33863/m.56577 type:complete len:332 (+) Transcript_33863:121-1116(+)
MDYSICRFCVCRGNADRAFYWWRWLTRVPTFPSWHCEGTPVAAAHRTCVAEGSCGLRSPARCWRPDACRCRSIIAGHHRPPRADPSRVIAGGRAPQSVQAPLRGRGPVLPGLVPMPRLLLPQHHLGHGRHIGGAGRGGTAAAQPRGGDRDPLPQLPVLPVRRPGLGGPRLFRHQPAAPGRQPQRHQRREHQRHRPEPRHQRAGHRVALLLLRPRPAGAAEAPGAHQDRGQHRRPPRPVPRLRRAGEARGPAPGPGPGPPRGPGRRERRGAEGGGGGGRAAVSQAGGVRPAGGARHAAPGGARRRPGRRRHRPRPHRTAGGGRVEVRHRGGV